MFEYDIFLSFSSKDKEYVQAIWQQLSSSGLRVFWSDETLKKNAGQSFFKVIQTSLEKSQHLILICSDDAMSSKWVQLEYETFFSNYHISNDGFRRIILHPLKRFSICSLPPFLKNLQLASSIKEILPLVGGVDIDLLMKENRKLKKELKTLSSKKESAIYKEYDDLLVGYKCVQEERRSENKNIKKLKIENELLNKNLASLMASHESLKEKYTSFENSYHEIVIKMDELNALNDRGKKVIFEKGVDIDILETDLCISKEIEENLRVEILSLKNEIRKFLTENFTKTELKAAFKSHRA